MRLIGPIVGVAMLLASLTACEEKRAGSPLPEGEFQFPAGVAVHPAGYALVTSSNFDLAFESGSLRIVDLNGLRLSDLATPDPADPSWSRFVLDDRSIGLDDFAGTIRLSADGKLAVVADRSSNRLVLIDVYEDEGGIRLDCWPDGRRPEGAFPKCDGAMHLLKLAQDDPYDVLLSEVKSGGNLVARKAIVSFLRSEFVSVWQLPLSGDADLPEKLFELELGDGVAGAGDLAYSPVSDRVFVGSRYPGLSSNPIHYFDWGQGASSVLKTEDLFTDMLGSETRGVKFAEDGLTLGVLVRNPDVLVFLDTAPLLDGSPSLNVVGEVLVGDNPTTLRFFDGTFFVMDAKGDTIYAVDGRTMRLRAASEEICRGPYDMAFWQPGDVTWALVACFEDNTLSILDVDKDSPDFMKVVVRVGPAMDRDY